MSTVELVLKEKGTADQAEYRLLLRDDERIQVETEIKPQLQAPVKKETDVGSVVYKLGEEIVYTSCLVTEKAVGKRNYIWCLGRVIKMYAMK